MASSSSSSISTPTKHDVFLSFRGEDTREKFTSHLHAKLIQKNIATYIDYNLPKGGDISKELIEAIQISRISVIIFSENYASSTWCLDEVMCILKCEKEYGQTVVPVFYDVDPSHVRKQRESYETAFAEHEERFKERREKVDEWRAALTEAAGKSGWDSRTYKGTEAEFIEAIAKDILKKLNGLYSSSNEFKDLVGMDKSIEEMDRLLCIDDSTTVRMIGIWGMGGLGKTTLARFLFQRLSSKFQGCCFLENVREESGKHDGLKSLEKKLLSDLLEENNLNSTFAKEKLRGKKVLIVLDDVDGLEQLEVLAADHDWFGPGSRIIVTTRDASVLRDRADEKYELQELDFDNSLQLFNSKAFKNSPGDGNTILSKRVVSHAGGNPLALKVLGTFLRSRRKEKWEIELKKLKEFPNQRLHNILKLSFDGLDETEQDIFLDVVCFFRIGLVTCRTLVEHRLGAHRSYVDLGIESLIDKSLISVKDNGILVVHDLLREMGCEIVRRQCIEEPGKRSRLWSEKDVYHVLKNNTGTQSIEGISCDISMGDSRDLSPTAFKEMLRLWTLDISTSIRTYNQFPQGFQYLPDSLKCLMWYRWPWKSLPSNFTPHNLVVLRMRSSKLERLWNGSQINLGNLKHVDLSDSDSLIEISALSEASNLESVHLSRCRSLRQVPALRFKNYEKSTSMDQSVNLGHKCSHSGCETLGQLKLDFCSNLKVVGKISGNVKELHLNSTSLEELPSSICSLENLDYLNLSNCRFLKNLPNDIQKLKSLKHLDLTGCSSVNKLSLLPRNLAQLDLSGTSIEQIPSSSIEHLSSLEKLDLRKCTRLKTLPTCICKLKSLKRLDLKDCNRLEIFPAASEPVKHLATLNSGKSGIGVSSSLASLHFLTSLDLSFCNLLEIPNDIGGLSSLQKLCLSGNDIEGIPDSIKNLSRLTELLVCNCKHLKSLPELPWSLEYLDACGCISLETILYSREDVLVRASSNHHVITFREFSYYGCERLNLITRNNLEREFLFRVYDTAIKSVQPHEMLKKSQRPGVGILLSEYMIPSWFPYQVMDSSIDIKLPPNWQNNSFLGFALCVVVIEDNGSFFKLSCEVTFKPDHDKSYKFHWDTIPFVKYRQPQSIFSLENLFMWYKHQNYRDHADAEWVSFHFYDESRKNEVGACGICFLYSDELLKSFSQF